MEITRVTTDGKARSTGKLMHEMVRRYHNDMLPYVTLSIFQVFDLIKNLPYRPDPPEEETLMRPYYTLNNLGTGGDCDDKSIALASWAYLNGIPYRFIACRRSDQKDLHHVYPELYIQDIWIPADATYSFNTLGREREEYAEKVII